ncbi:MAG: pyruvoyl-dependent arginine decarboxylase [Acidimicrobiales bacterium]
MTDTSTEHGTQVAPPTTGLVIPVVSAVGEGPTEIAAFDAALRSAGVGDLNLIRLSSVIPTGATIEVHLDERPPRTTMGAGWGDKHYVVYADARATSPGDTAAACVGWVQDEATGEGLFVEIEGDDESTVRSEVRASLDAMVAGRSRTFSPPTLLSRSVTCEDRPVCALVIASFTTDGWT